MLVCEKLDVYQCALEHLSCVFKWLALLLPQGHSDVDLVGGKHEHEHEHDYEHELHGGIQGRPPQYSAAPDPRRRASTIHGHRIMTETTASHCTGVPSGQSVSPTRSRFISKLFIGGLPAATYSPTSRQWLFLTVAV